MSNADCAPAVDAAAIKARGRRRRMMRIPDFGCLSVIVTRAVWPAGLSRPVPEDGSNIGAVVVVPPPNDAAPGIDGFNPSAMPVAPPGVLPVYVVVVPPFAAFPSDVPRSAVSTLAVLTAAPLPAPRGC